MKKLSLIFCLTMLFLISNCTEQSNNSITNSQEHQIENKENSAIDPYVSSVLNAAERDIPISTDDGYTIGVLDENRTENHCYVLYYNSKELQKYRFIKDAYWNIDS